MPVVVLSSSTSDFLKTRDLGVQVRLSAQNNGCRHPTLSKQKIEIFLNQRVGTEYFKESTILKSSRGTYAWIFILYILKGREGVYLNCVS